MSFYGKVFNNLVSWIFKKGETEIKMGTTEDDREVLLGEGLEINGRTINVTPCVLKGTINGATLYLNIQQQTNTTTQEEE